MSLKVFRSGREVCVLSSAEGRRIYKSRLLSMMFRQRGLCCLFGHAPDCPGSLIGWEPTFDHEFGRGMGGGKRDDRIEVDGKWQNGAAHLECNIWKGSRVIAYNEARNRTKGLKG